MSRLAGAAVAVAALVMAATATAQTGGLTLEEAVKLALERNLDLTIERLNPLIAREQVREARGAFDPVVGMGLTHARTERFLTNILEAQAEGGTVVEEVLTADYPSLTGRLVTGTQYSFGLTTPIVKTDHPLRLFDEYYQPVLTLGLTQPLLRDFGIAINTVRINQARTATVQATLGVEARMLTVVRDVEIAYWSLFGAEQHVARTRDSLALAEDLVERLTRMRAAGLATDLDVMQGRTAAEGRRAALARGQGELATAQATFRLLIDPGADRPEAVAVAGAPPDDAAPADLSGRLARALARRPEIHLQEAVIERTALAERVARNDLQPRLDLIGGAGLNSLAGRGVNPRFPGELPERLRGRESYSDALGDLFTGDANVSWWVGLRLQVPLGNREAKARLEQVRLRRRQEELRLSLLRSQIRLEVQGAFEDLRAQAARLAAARDAAALAREHLTAEERAFAAGRATIRQVLEAQETVAIAAEAESQARVAHAHARARLSAAEAQNLETYRLVVQR
jgi:outer membrane protein